MVNQDFGRADPATMYAGNDGPPVADMRAYGWIVAILCRMKASSDRMADNLVRERLESPALERDQYVRDSRELWDRYRYLIGIYEDAAWSLSDPFKAKFAAWQSAFLQSGAGDAPIDRARHYQASMTKFTELAAAACIPAGAACSAGPGEA